MDLGLDGARALVCGGSEGARVVVAARSASSSPLVRASRAQPFDIDLAKAGGGPRP